MVFITFSLNGETKNCNVEPGDYLVHLIREKLGMTGTKQGCDTGGCGVCTVLLDGKPIYSCMTPAWRVEGHTITTIEGIGSNDTLDSLQSAMIENFSAQCGYCTGAIILVGKSLLASNPHPNETQVRKALSGVLCRCTNYERYIDAIINASRKIDRDL